MYQRLGFVAPLTVLGLALLVFMLPVVVFMVGQNQNPSSHAEESVPTTPAFIMDQGYVDSDLPDKSLAPSSELWVDGSSVKITYIKLNLTSLASKKVSSANLRFFVIHSSNSTQNVHEVLNSTWEASSLTFASRPDLGRQVATIKGGQAGETENVDLTSFVQSHLGDIISIGIDSGGVNGLGIKDVELVVDSQ